MVKNIHEIPLPEAMDNYNRKNVRTVWGKSSNVPNAVIYMDAEWSYDSRLENDADDDVLNDLRNMDNILSQQIFVDPMITENQPYESIDPFAFVAYGHMTINELINYIKERMGLSHRDNFKVLVVGYWVGVDITTFDKWEKISADSILPMRKFAMFTTDPVTVPMTSSGKQSYNCDFMFRDDMLLAPGHSNLAMLGDSIGYPKLDTELWSVEDGYVKTYYKEHMDVLLKDRPQDYIDYAMTDTFVTAIYFSQVLPLAGSSPTLGSAAARKANQLVTNNQYLTNMAERLSIDENDTRVYSFDNDGVWSMDKVKVLSLIYGYRPTTYRPNARRILVVNSDDDSKAKTHKQRVLKNVIAHLESVNGVGCVDELQDVQIADIVANSFALQRDYEVADTIRSIDPVDATREYFQVAIDSYKGGVNYALTYGLFNENHQNLVADIDLKGAYNTNGHLIPNSAFGVIAKEWEDKKSYDPDFTDDVIAYADNLNGPYTVGTVIASVSYPTNYTGNVLVPTRINRKGAISKKDGKLSTAGTNPVYVKNVDHAHLTLTDAYTAINQGAKVVIHQAVIYWQETLDGTLDTIFPIGKYQDMCMQNRKQAKADGRSLDDMIYKELGNSVYGKSAQALLEKESRGYDTNEKSLEPLSAITCPVLASQYTALTRYHLSCLEEALYKVDPDMVLHTVTTDGVLVETTMSEEDFTNGIDGVLTDCFDVRLQHVAETFMGDYYELKGSVHGSLLVMRTRVSIALHAKNEDAEDIVALTSFDKHEENIINQLFVEMADNTTSHETKVNRMMNLMFMKHNEQAQHLMETKRVVKLLSLAYDFSNKPTKMLGDHGYSTEPYSSHGEYAEFKDFMFQKNKKYEYGRNFDSFEALQTHWNMRVRGEYIDEEITPQSAMKAYVSDLALRTEKGGSKKLLGEQYDVVKAISGVSDKTISNWIGVARKSTKMIDTNAITLRHAKQMIDEEYTKGQA